MPRSLPLLALLLAGCDECAWLGTEAQLTVAAWDLPEGVDHASLRVDDGREERWCRVTFEGPLEWDEGSPTEPDIVDSDCPDAWFTYTYIREWGVVYLTRYTFRRVDVELVWEMPDGETGGFLAEGLRVDWTHTPFDHGPACFGEARGSLHLDPDGQPFAPP